MSILIHTSSSFHHGSGIVLKWTLTITPSRASPKESPAEPLHEEIEGTSCFMMNLDLLLIARDRFDNLLKNVHDACAYRSE